MEIQNLPAVSFIIWCQLGRNQRTNQRIRLKIKGYHEMSKKGKKEKTRMMEENTQKADLKVRYIYIEAFLTSRVPFTLL